MRLKSLRLHGFKSFADRQEFTFPRGITCIVGPNGCGKSNVVDSVKWVLGEQKPSALRGAEMSDVIFSGTSARKPLGMAEVSLLFDNSDGVLDIDFTEVEVTRRLYRDGTSEYLLNRNKCRLRDLRELLMDTGSGPGALTFMEQGRIDRILRESQAERRAVFEEAAGVAKYKARRKETLRRLQRVEADLLRVSDVVEERQRQVRSLKIQAGRAERYQALLEEMNTKRLKLAVHRYGLLLHERDSATEQVELLAVREEAARAEVAAAAAACESAESELETSRVAATSKETEIATVEGQAETAREKAAFSTRLVAELDGKIRWYADEIESFVERLQELETERTELAEAHRTALSEREARTADTQEADEAGRVAREAANTVRAETQDISRRHFALLDTKSKLASEASRLEAEDRALRDRRERAASRSAEIDAAAGSAASALEEAAVRLDAALADVTTGQEALAAAEKDVEERDARVGHLRDVVQSTDRDVSSLRSRQDVLRKLEARMEGVGKGPRRLLEAAAADPRGVPGVRGLLADLVRTDAEHAAVVETALGEFATAIVVDTWKDALNAVEHVERHRMGRCTFLPLDSVAEADGVDVPAEARSLLAAVTCDPAVLAAVAAVLGHAVVVDDLDGARALHAAGRAVGLRVVTGGGAVLHASGAVSAGGEAGGAGIVQRNAELAQIEERLEAAIVRLEQGRDELARAQEALADARTAVTSARQDVRTADAAAHRARGERDRARSESDRLARERERLTSVLEDLARQSGGSQERRDEVARELASVRTSLEELEGVRSDAEARLRAAEEASRAAESRRADCRVELASVRERCNALESRRAAQEREAKELEEGVVDARKELELSDQRREAALERGKEARAQMEAAQKRRDVCVRDLVELRHAVSTAQRRLEEHRGLRKTLDSEAAAVNRELSKFRMRQNEARLRVENLLERIQEELEIDLHAAWSERREEPSDGSDTAAEDAGTPVYAEPPSAVADEPFDADAIEKSIVDLKAKLGRMGAVNLEALAQLEEAQSEAEHLLVQHDDLTRSRDALLEAIKKIDKESRHLFTTTFEKIQTNFREMFRKLFGGGKADVFLEPGQDVLEAGVEIVARPPGKELRSISLLSGGERTMTAVALMFAIYRACPSPFCLLDEVDAALDEGNIDRFVAAVHEFAEESQFIVVTHNKRTMGMADTIFGVSMPEPGVSKRLAVRLEDVDEDGALRVDAA